MILWSITLFFQCVLNVLLEKRKNLLQLKIFFCEHIYNYLHLYLYWQPHALARHYWWKQVLALGFLLIQTHERDTWQKVAQQVHLTKSCTKGTPDKKLHKKFNWQKSCNDIDGNVVIQTHTKRAQYGSNWICDDIA